MKTRQFIAITCLLGLNTYSDAIVLQSSVLHLLDGLPYGIDGETLFELGRLIKKMRDMLLGQLIDDVKKERVGLYLFKGKKYGITALAELETQYKNDATATAELQKVLHEIKKDFIAATKPFINQIQQQKSLVMKLMVESCERRGVPNSSMLNWGETQAGHEEESFEKLIPNLTAMNKFLNELGNFMGDIFQSCPKGYKQYEEIIRKQRAIGVQKK